MSPIIINVYFESNRLWNYFVCYLINKCKYECKHAWARSKCERKQENGETRSAMQIRYAVIVIVSTMGHTLLVQCY